MWSIWIGFFMACHLAVLATYLTTKPGQPVEVLDGYPMLAILSGLAFFTLGANYWGKCYAFGIAFFGLSLTMPLRLPWAPLEFGLLWTLASF